MTVTKEKARKKTIAGLLALAMGASALPAAPVLAGEGGGAPAWTACTECSEESPHIITTKEELDAIRTHINTEGHVDGYFQLGDDIVFEKADFEEGGAFYNGGLGWMPIGHDGTTHSENADYEPAICDIWLDGNGYTISGLEHYSRPGDITSGKDSWGNTPAIEYSGLIGIAGDATIQDLVIEDTLMYLQYGGGAIYGAGSNGTVVDNVTLRNVEVLNQYIYSGSDGAAVAFGIAGGRISNITLENCGSLFHSAEENGDQCWHSALFADRILSGTTIDGVTITDCQLDANKDSGLFSTYLGDKGETTVSNIRVANVTVDGLEVNRAHPFVAYFAYDTYAYNADPTAFTARYPKTYENVTFENISMDAAVNYSGYTAEPAKMLPDLVPQAAGVTLKNSVMVYHQGADYALFTEDTLAGVYSNVYVVRDLKDAAATVICVAADGTRSEAAVAVPESLTLQVGGVSEETLSLNLEGAELSYESSDESTAKLLEDGKVQGVGEGTTDIRVMVRMTEEMSLPLLRTEVIVEGPNKDALALRYDECVAASEDDYYTEETREALKEAAEKAKLVLDSRTATQADVDTALAALEQAIGEMLPSDYHLDSLIYEGRSNVTVYVSETANALEKFAMTELQKYLGLVGDVRISQAASVKPGQNLQIVLGTPESYPELTELFPEDLEYLADSDGFAVRQIDNIIYIFAAEYKGVINGVYDFLEENAGIIWTRGVEELGTLYETAETVAVKKADYREKSPFRYRTWNSCGMGSTGIHHIDQDYTYFEARNKINMGGDEIGTQIIDGVKYNLAGSIINSGTATLWIDKYFDEHPEYFMTDKFGEPLRSQYGSNLNFYSMEAAEALAAELIALSEKQGSNIVDHGIQDNQHFCMIVDDGEGGKVDLASLPFTTEDGVTVTPDMKNYKSTVFFNFLNHVARTIKKTNPDIRITTLSYIYTETPPAMPIEDNIIIVFAPIYADDHAPITAPSNASTKANLDGWAKLTKNVMVYNYYFSLPSTIYSRPIAEKVQADLQYYASLGLLGLNPEGNVDSSIEDSDSNKAWDMNTMYMWEMNQLFWDPYLDLDELTRKYCKLAYGEAADDMYRYYELIQEGWDSDDSYVWYITGADTYIKKLVIDAGVADEVLTCLDSAYEKTDGVEQKRIAPIRQTMYEQIDLFTDFETEDGVAYYNESGKDVLTAEENLTISSGPWADVKPLTVFKTTGLTDSGRNLQIRLMWDKENLYIASILPNEKIGTDQDPHAPEKEKPLSDTDNWWTCGGEFMENYICGDMTYTSNYAAYFSNAYDHQLMYNSNIEFQAKPYSWESFSKVHTEGEPSERYWMNVQVIPFATMGVTWDTAVLGGTFLFNTDTTVVDDNNPFGTGIFGWCGAGNWSTASFRRIQLADAAGSIEEETGKAYYNASGESVLTAKENLTISSGPWADAKPLTMFKHNKNMSESSRDLQVRMLWDKENFYVATIFPNEKIGTENDPHAPEKEVPMSSTDNWWTCGGEYTSVYLCGDMTTKDDYSCYYANGYDHNLQYNVGVVFQPGPYKWKSYSRIHTEGEPEERYWMCVRVIPFDVLGVSPDNAALGGTFLFNTDDNGTFGWYGSGSWSPASFRSIELVDETGGDLPDDGPVVNPYLPSKDITPAPETSVDLGKWVQADDGHWEYHSKDGTPLTGWQKDKGTWYYMDDNGVMLTGWQKIDGVWYYLYNWGGMATGWLWWNGDWYYLSEDGSMLANCWLLWNGNWYFFNRGGAMLADDWILWNDSWYYLSGNGVMITNQWVLWKGNWYYLTNSGKMAADTVINGYTVNANGIWIA